MGRPLIKPNKKNGPNLFIQSAEVTDVKEG